MAGNDGKAVGHEGGCHDLDQARFPDPRVPTEEDDLPQPLLHLVTSATNR